MPSTATATDLRIPHSRGAEGRSWARLWNSNAQLCSAHMHMTVFAPSAPYFLRSLF
eukprot:COSAG02_NODE_1521_length_12162_cov_3.464147_13_plen_56_part_00